MLPQREQNFKPAVGVKGMICTQKNEFEGNYPLVYEQVLWNHHHTLAFSLKIQSLCSTTFLETTEIGKTGQLHTLTAKSP
eukprot:g43085.t1